MKLTFSSVLASLKKFLEEEFECAICLETCTDTLVNPECNHRFCGKCIKESLNKCNHECPTCGVPIPTYRTCRRDPQFDHIVSTVMRRKRFNDLKAFKAEFGHDCNVPVTRSNNNKHTSLGRWCSYIRWSCKAIKAGGMPSNNKLT
jgi:hypothetical protein